MLPANGENFRRLRRIEAVCHERDYTVKCMLQYYQKFIEGCVEKIENYQRSFGKMGGAKRMYSKD